MYAYEDENNGILVQYLQRYLHHFKPIKDIFAEVQEGIVLVLSRWSPLNNAITSPQLMSIYYIGVMCP